MVAADIHALETLGSSSLSSKDIMNYKKKANPGSQQSFQGSVGKMGSS